MKNNVIIIIGPTASGKTDIAVSLAKVLDGEVISADSSQVYCGLDVGSAKVTKEEMQGVKHHLIDIKQPFEEFNVAEFKSLALAKINEILKKNKVPIVCGGTGLYVRALIDDYDFENTPKSQEIRQKLESEYDIDPEGTYKRLKDLAPLKAEKISANDKLRIVRALEILQNTNKSENKQQNDFNYIVYVLNKDRQELYTRINKRVDLMVENGLFEEVENLIKKGITNQNSCFKSIGYKEVYDYFKDKLDKQQTIELIKQKTRNYAKRQFTFFRSIKNAIWIEDTQNRLQEIINDYKHREN